MIPRKLWMLWYQGVSQAPLVVRKCVDSWVRENPGWDIILLDQRNVGDYVQAEMREQTLRQLPVEKRANLLRLQLLSTYGGVWADATTYCMTPLDNWIHQHSPSGFFAFARPGRDRLLSNWFLAATPDNHLVKRWKENYIAFFEEHQFPPLTEAQQLLVRLLGQKFSLGIETTRHWFDPLVTRELKVYPYFIMHYLFERTIATDPQSRAIWDKTPAVSADGPHRLMQAGLFAPATQALIQEIQRKEQPLYKLSWKYDPAKYSAGSLLYYLLEHYPGQPQPAPRCALPA